jgi:hypothetical protein
MKLLVFSKPIPGSDRTRYIDEEEETIERLREQGFIQQIYVRDDGGGAVSVVEAASIDQCLETLHELPFVSNGCITVEAVPVKVLEQVLRTAGSE